MKEELKLLLGNLFDKYKNQGVEAIYLWGSITTPDFNPATSDIDTIAVVDDSIDISFEKNIKDFVASYDQKFKKFGFRILYKSELNGGEIKSFLASVIDPKILLLDIPYWELVVGTNFTQEDFILTLPTYTDAIAFYLNRIKKEKWLQVPLIQNGYHGHILFMKVLARIVYFQQNSRGIVSPFSYSSVLLNSNGIIRESEIIQAILNIKKHDWNYVLFQEYSSIFQKFIDYLLRKN